MYMYIYLYIYICICISLFIYVQLYLITIVKGSWSTAPTSRSIWSLWHEYLSQDAADPHRPFLRWLVKQAGHISSTCNAKVTVLWKSSLAFQSMQLQVSAEGSTSAWGDTHERKSRGTAVYRTIARMQKG